MGKIYEIQLISKFMSEKPAGRKENKSVYFYFWSTNPEFKIKKLTPE